MGFILYAIKEGATEMEQTVYGKYKDAYNRAKKNYMAKKKQTQVLFEPEEYEEIKAYCEREGISMQRMMKECILAKVREH